MMDSQQPCVEISENYMNHGQVCLGIRLVSLDRERIVAVAKLSEVVVADPAICANERTWSHCRKYERFQFLLCTAWNNLEAQSSGNDATPMPATVLWIRLPGWQVRIGAGSLGSGTYLHSSDDQRLVMDTSALSLGCTAYPFLVYFHGPFPADTFSVRTDHRGPQLVEHMVGSLVPRQPEQFLEL